MSETNKKELFNCVSVDGMYVKLLRKISNSDLYELMISINNYEKGRFLNDFDYIKMIDIMMISNRPILNIKLYDEYMIYRKKTIRKYKIDKIIRRDTC